VFHLSLSLKFFYSIVFNLTPNYLNISFPQNAISSGQVIHPRAIIHTIINSRFRTLLLPLCLLLRAHSGKCTIHPIMLLQQRQLQSLRDVIHTMAITLQRLRQRRLLKETANTIRVTTQQGATKMPPSPCYRHHQALPLRQLRNPRIAVVVSHPHCSKHQLNRRLLRL
jgi:hypothetical protein